MATDDSFCTNLATNVAALSVCRSDDFSACKRQILNHCLEEGTPCSACPVCPVYSGMSSSTVPKKQETPPPVPTLLPGLGLGLGP